MLDVDLAVSILKDGLWELTENDIITAKNKQISKILARNPTSTLELLDPLDDPSTLFDVFYKEIPTNPIFKKESILIIEQLDAPTFYYGMKGVETRQDTNIKITMACQGKKGLARTKNYNVTLACKEYLLKDHTFGGLCTGSTIEQELSGYVNKLDETLVSASQVFVQLKE